jgi:hypothetical protein
MTAKAAAQLTLPDRSLAPLEVVALSKVETKAVRDQVAPGAYEVDVRVRCAGSLFLAGDFEQKPRLTQEDLLAVLATALDSLKRGTTPELVILQAQTSPPNPRLLEALKARLVEHLLADRPASKSRGGVRANLEFTRLG